MFFMKINLQILEIISTLLLVINILIFVFSTFSPAQRALCKLEGLHNEHLYVVDKLYANVCLLNC